jgi:hypothetical protein
MKINTNIKKIKNKIFCLNNNPFELNNIILNYLII